MSIEIWADTARVEEIERLAGEGLVKGFTTNPTLMRKAGVRDYKGFAKDVLRVAGGLPVSFEVPGFKPLDYEVKEISSWSPTIYVKVPILGEDGRTQYSAIEGYAYDKVNLNITGVVDPEMVEFLPEAPLIISIFVGRVMDTGRNSPFPISRGGQRYLWASTREVHNIMEAEAKFYDIITVTPEILAKLPLIGRDLGDYTRETVSQLYKDAKEAGYQI